MRHRYALAAVLFLGLAVAALAPWRQAPRPAETAEQFALRYFEATMQRRDRAGALAMLCADGYQYHEAVTLSQIAFWSGPDVAALPHDFRVARVVALPDDIAHGDGELMVWVAFRYAYTYQGVTRELEPPDGTRVYITEDNGTYCVSPWAG
jgi:hypothetical protein